MARRTGRPLDLTAIVVAVALILTGTTANTQQPRAQRVPVRTNWYGIDGTWSPVSLRVGDSTQSGPQWVDLFVSTAARETLVVDSRQCGPSDIECGKKRGGLFNPNNSRSWEEVGTYDLGLDPQLGFDQNNTFGLYGNDSIALDDRISVQNQTVGVIVVDSIERPPEYHLGFFGLDIQETNLNETRKPSFLGSMVENQIIPSHSYGYTAGAFYRRFNAPNLTTAGYS